MMVVVPVPKGKSLPDLPPGGIRTAQDSSKLPGSEVINTSNFDASHLGVNVAPGPEPGTFVYAKKILHQNLFQIPLP